MRLKTGDTDEFDEGLADEVYEYLYASNDSNENRASLEALKMLVFKYASYVTEKAGGVFVKENEKYEQYKNLLNLVTKDPSFSFLETGKPYAGGINLCKRLSEPSSNPFNLGETQRVSSGHFYSKFRRV
jgi:hypothetical protein